MVHIEDAGKGVLGKKGPMEEGLGERLVFDPLNWSITRVFLTGSLARGRRKDAVLATASDRIIAEQVAGHVGLFSDVMASDSAFNLRGEKKAEALVSRFGDRGSHMLETASMTCRFGKRPGSNRCQSEEVSEQGR